MSQHPGETLRAAREAQGLDVDTVAQRLRLMTRQITAIEEGDFDSLGQPVFARGFVRNYARLLGIDPNPLVTAMQGEPETPNPPVSEPEGTEEPVVVRRLGWLGSPWFLVLALAVLLLIAAPVGLYVWLNSDADDVPPVEASATSVVPVESTAPAPAVQSVAEAASTASAETTAEPADGAVPQPAAENVVPPQTPVPAAVAPPPAASMPVVDDGGPAEHTLELSFLGDAWVEIRDASGRFVHRQLDRSGSKVVVDGEPPFDLVIGNAREVRLSHNGRPLDLSPFIDITVARFTLEE